MYQFSPRSSKKFKVTLPSKNAKWNDSFVFFKILDEVDVSVFWKASRVVDDWERVGFLSGFLVFNGETAGGELD